MFIGPKYRPRYIYYMHVIVQFQVDAAVTCLDQVDPHATSVLVGLFTIYKDSQDLTFMHLTT